MSLCDSESKFQQLRLKDHIISLGKAQRNQTRSRGKASGSLCAIPTSIPECHTQVSKPTVSSLVGHLYGSEFLFFLVLLG